MKKIVTLLSVILLASSVASAQEAEPDIEINLDVLQQFQPPARPPVRQLVITPAKEPMEAAPKKYVTKHKAKKPVAKKRTAKKRSKHKKKKIHTHKQAYVPVLPPVETPVPEPVKQPEPPVVAVPETPSAPVVAEAPVVTSPPPSATPPVPEATLKQRFVEKTDVWLLKVDEWQNGLKQWLNEKKQPAAPAPEPAPQPEPTPEPQPQPATSSSSSGVEPVPVPSANTEEVKPLEPFAIPPETAVDELKKETPSAAATLADKPKTEAIRLREQVDIWLLRVDAWQEHIKNWFNKKTAPASAPVAEPVAEAPTAAPVAEPAPPTDLATPETAPPVQNPDVPTAVIPALATDLAQPATEAAPEIPPAALHNNSTNTPAVYTVLFAAGQAAVADAEIAPLGSLADKLRIDKDTRITVLGYAPLTEGMQESEARKLSLKRAIAVRQILIKQGIESTRINVQALGSDAPGVVKDRVDIVKLR